MGYQYEYPFALSFTLESLSLRRHGRSSVGAKSCKELRLRHHLQMCTQKHYDLENSSTSPNYVFS